MAGTVNSDVIIYDDLAQTSYLERIQDVIAVFNASSNGAIVLQNSAIIGDYKKRAFYQIGGSLEHRDVNSNAVVVPRKIGTSEAVGVKVPFKYGPYAATEESFKRRGVSPEEFSMLMGIDAADASLAGYFEYMSTGMVAAIGANTNMVATGSIATDGKKTLTRGMRKFGDRFGRLALWMMDSETYFDIVDQSIDAQIFNEADVVIYGGSPGTMGKPVLITDRAPAKTILGLQRGAGIVTESQAPAVRTWQINDQENLGMGYRLEGTFNLDLLGYSYKTTAGANPNLATIGAAASWEKNVDSDKLTAGVLINLT